MVLSQTLQDFKIRYNNITLQSHICNYLFYPSYRIIWLFRLIQFTKLPTFFQKLLRLYYIRQCNKFGISLSPDTSIGDGLIFPHDGPVVINPSSIIGRNCIIHPCVLIGGNRKKQGAPIIGDNVFIGNGAKIIGPIKIGNDVFISPGAIITKDIGNDHIVGGGVNNILKTCGGKLECSYYQCFNL